MCPGTRSMAGLPSGTTSWEHSGNYFGKCQMARCGKKLEISLGCYQAYSLALPPQFLWYTQEWTSKMSALVRYRLSPTRKGKLWWKICLHPCLEQKRHFWWKEAMAVDATFFSHRWEPTAPEPLFYNVFKNWDKFDTCEFKEMPDLLGY